LGKTGLKLLFFFYRVCFAKDNGNTLLVINIGKVSDLFKGGIYELIIHNSYLYLIVYKKNNKSKLMEKDMKNVGDIKGIIIGGTGFIGYHAVKEFITRGYDLTIIAKDTVKDLDIPKNIQIILADINILEDSEVLELFKGYDFLVYAAGADDRVIPPKPAYDFFYRENVASSQRILSIAKAAGIRKAILLGSYFAYFNRIWPNMELTKKHPYIRSRVEQEEACLKTSGEDFQVCILELPYIFGYMEGRKSLWQPLINYIKSPYPLFYTKGGTNMIAVEHVAEAIVGAVDRGQGGRIYTVGDENVTWNDLLNHIMTIMGIKKKIIIVPTFILKGLMYCLSIVHRVKGKESGLNPVDYVYLQTVNTFFDPKPAIKALGYKTGGLNEALEKNIKGSFYERRKP